MSPCKSDVVQIVETQAELRTDERIGWRIHFSSYAVGLETENTRSHVVYVVTPTCNHRVTVDLFAWHARSSKGTLEGVPCLLVSDLLLQANATASANEGVLSTAAA